VALLQELHIRDVHGIMQVPLHGRRSGVAMPF
jgi:hypothetical protein